MRREKSWGGKITLNFVSLIQMPETLFMWEAQDLNKVYFNEKLESILCKWKKPENCNEKKKIWFSFPSYNSTKKTHFDSSTVLIMREKEERQFCFLWLRRDISSQTG